MKPPQKHSQPLFEHATARGARAQDGRMPQSPAQDLRSLVPLLAHPLWGLLILVGALGMTLFVTYYAAIPAANWLYTTVFHALSHLVDAWLGGLPAWARVVLSQGVIGGVGTVLSFVPILLVFFTVLGLLEESNYLAYASRITDRYLQWIGLPGMACIPLSMGFGCNTSAILGCRVLKERRSRLLTMLLVPFVPCTSRLAVVALLTPVFFGGDALWVTWGLVTTNLVVLAGVGFTVNWLRPRKTGIPHMLALPNLRVPQPRRVLAYITRNILEFLTKMRILVFFSTLVWALSYFPNGQIGDSYLAAFGQALVPAGRLAGLEDWRFIVAMLASFASKENVIAVLGVLFPLVGGEHTLSTQVGAALSPAARLSFLVMQMLFIPCASTLAAIRQESASWKFVVLQTGLMLGASVVTGVIVFQVLNIR